MKPVLTWYQNYTKVVNDKEGKEGKKERDRKGEVKEGNWTSISHEYSCKNPQQNISRLNPIIHKK